MKDCVILQGLFEDSWMDTDRSVELSLTLICIAEVLKVNCMKLKIVKVRFALPTSGNCLRLKTVTVRFALLMSGGSSKRSIAFVLGIACIALLCFAF